MLMLAIESSCDETAVALLDCQPPLLPKLLAHTMHSQVELHALYGGVVPELASRDHLTHILPLMQKVLEQIDGVHLSDLDYIAYTQGPGLAGALMIGATVAQTLAFALDIPSIGVHHLEGHIMSGFFAPQVPEFPFIALLVSGGHTELILVHHVGEYEILGSTVDDAAGEAFDKCAKLLDIPYPGGAVLSQLARSGLAHSYTFPRPLLHSNSFDFSFSGLKTAVAHKLQTLPELTRQIKQNLAASIQQAIVEVLTHKTKQALLKYQIHNLVLAGGVAANWQLRQTLATMSDSIENFRLCMPPVEFCTDNAAMIGMAAGLRLLHGKLPAATAKGDFSVKPRWSLKELSGRDS